MCLIRKFSLSIILFCFVVSSFPGQTESAKDDDKGGQSIIMDGSSLIMKENDKKKKGDTIVIKDGGGGCGCGGKKPMPMPMPFPIVIPKKEVKYVHVPVPVHHGWGGGHEMMHHGFARADESLSETLVKPIEIGEKLDSVDYGFPSDGEAKEESEPIPLSDDLATTFNQIRAINYQRITIITGIFMVANFHHIIMRFSS